MSERRRGRSGRPQRPGEQRTDPQPRGGGGGDPRPGWRQTIDSFGGLLTVGSVGAALLVVAILVIVNRPGGGGSDTEYQPVEGERELASGRMIGSADAPVRIIEFSDFQCPVCKRYTDEVAPIIYEEYVETGIASIEYWHLPVINASSITAGEAAECALDQDMFWQFHDLMFQKQDGSHSGVDLSVDRLSSYAEEMAAAHPDRAWDQAAFRSCLESGEKRSVVEDHVRAATEVGARSTPSFLINGQLLPGLNPLDVFRRAIDDAAAAAGQ